MEENLNKKVEKLKRKGSSLDNGIVITQMGEVRHILVRVSKASFKGKSWSEMSTHEKQDFEDLLYLSNVQKGNPKITYAI